MKTVDVRFRGRRGRRSSRRTGGHIERDIHPRCTFRALDAARTVPAHRMGRRHRPRPGSASSMDHTRCRPRHGEKRILLGRANGLRSAPRLRASWMGTPAIRGDGGSEPTQRRRTLVAYPLTGDLPLSDGQRRQYGRPRGPHPRSPGRRFFP